MQNNKMDDLKENPFASLFPSLSVAQSYKDKHQKIHGSPEGSRLKIETSPSKSVNLSKDESVKDIQELNNIIEEVFLFTLNKFSVIGGDQDQLIFLSSLADIIGTHSQTWLDLHTLEQALFERLMLESPLEHLVTGVNRLGGVKTLNHSQTIETQAVRYLISSYKRAMAARHRLGKKSKYLADVDRMKEIIVQNMVTAFQEPDFYVGQNLQKQMSEQIVNSFDVDNDLVELLKKFAVQAKQHPLLLERIFHPVLDEIKATVKITTTILFSLNSIIPLQYFTSCPVLGRILILHSFPHSKGPQNGRGFEDTLLGSIIAKSCLPSTDNDHWDFFNQPSGQPASVHSATEGRIWSGLESVHSAGQFVIKQMLKLSEDTKHLVLYWLGNCISANQARGKMWTNQMGPLLAAGLASDGFMLNLGSVLLRLAAPLTETVTKMEKVEPSYTGLVTLVSEDKRLAHHHMTGLQTETCLVSVEEADRERRETLPSYNFPTEIFFMAHKTLDIGFRPVQEKFIKLNQELGRLQNAYRDAAAAGGGEAAEMIQKNMENAMQRYLTYKAALLEPSTMDNMTKLMAATGSWLVKITTNDVSSLPESQLPIADFTSPLSFIPEFVLENICEHLLLVKRFNPAHFEQVGPKLGDILMVILCYMDQPGLVRNPHLRARLAESLECLLPGHEVQGQPNILGSYQRQGVFSDHQHSMRIAPAILHVFVSIEETGHSVQFEQKFSYRRPMYDIIKYIWEIDAFKNKFRQLAKEAERDVENEHPPLFLRFINLLINDAIFLLDEGLGFMKQIQEKEAERPSWSSLPENERSEAERGFHHMSMMARYHNIMGIETISVIELLTTSITEVVTHPTMADRLAAMLNYFLKTLTGPDRKSFKVSNLDKYSFKPGEVVSRISQIYINLESSETFVKAISADGRSYCPELFSWAENVLLKVSRADLATSLTKVAEKVRTAADSLAEEEELLADCPEEFLCPIMSVVMTDPVSLPSSKQTVDRSTIARHLLSDQSDPFNREPLTMDMLETDEELKEKVRQWMESRKRK